jgi:hypothetical protein
MAARPGTMRAKGGRACRARTAERERFGAKLNAIDYRIGLSRLNRSIRRCLLVRLEYLIQSRRLVQRISISFNTTARCFVMVRRLELADRPTVRWRPPENTSRKSRPA